MIPSQVTNIEEKIQKHLGERLRVHEKENLGPLYKVRFEVYLDDEKVFFGTKFEVKAYLEGILLSIEQGFNNDEKAQVL